MSFRRIVVALAAASLAGAVVPSVSQAASCTSGLSYDPSIPTWEQFFADHPDPDAVLPLSRGGTGAGGGAPAFGSGAPNPTGRNLTKVVLEYWDGLVAATADNPRVRVIKKYLGQSAIGDRELAFYVIGSAGNIARLDGPTGDAAFWRGVRSGEIPTDVGLEAAGSKPAFAWVTATPHGGEAAAAESITRSGYELLARLDCENAKRLDTLDVFYQPVRNPDGRDAIQRYTAFGFDPNRDFGTQNQQENKVMVPEMNQYPGVFFIDAHQQSSGYFFPPNEDPVHHEISDFALDFIQHKIGPTLQQVFNDQSAQYQNYNSYDLFTPEYGDTVPALIMGAAGMTYEKGNSEVYGKQVYDHYLAIDTTLNLTANDKVNILSNWVRQWGEAVAQGQACALQQNKLVSPLHDRIKQQVSPEYTVCGYFFKPDQHVGDTQAMLSLLMKTGVRVYKLDTPVAVNGYHEYGDGTNVNPDTDNVRANVRNGQTLPAGTYYIPMNQGMKHWIQALLGENPWIPYDYYYDVVTWSYPLQRGLAGSGFLTTPMSPGIQMTELTQAPQTGSAPPTVSPVYAFNTDSAKGLTLAIDLLDKGVNVYRATQSFTASGKQFYTGAALVDGSSVAGRGVDLAALASKRQTPIIGLNSFPAPRKQLAKPKIGLYTGAATIPTNPLFRSGPNVNGTTGYCSSNSFCEALHDLAIKNEIPLSVLYPVTSADLANNRLATDGFTALINPGFSIATTSTSGTPPVTTITPTGTNLLAFMNNGGNYVGINGNGVSAARTIGATTLNTTTIAGLLTPGATLDATFDTTNPVAWGFDLGGWIYRDSNSNPVFDTATLDGTSVVTYAPTQDEEYGFESNVSQLVARPAVVDKPTGSGHAVMIGYNPFYRSWKEQDERIALNAALYPKGATIGGTAPTPESAQPAPQLTAIAPAAAPIAKADLPKVGAKASAPVKAVSRADRDVRIRVKRADGAKLKAAVKAAHLSKSVKRKLRYSTTKSSVTLVIKGVRTSDEHARKTWVGRITKQLDRRKVDPLYALV
ncbi:MAG TPA: M14 family zinc carboxypeptidase [Solirubrobacter sp.]|nr:M14 family zinc carboxypeptidase [Solirubrobacter sp.]